MIEKLVNEDIKIVEGLFDLKGIEESINKLKSDFDRIGVNGDVWTGKVANISKETFDELVTKYYEFKNIDREYIDYLDRK